MKSISNILTQKSVLQSFALLCFMIIFNCPKAQNQSTGIVSSAPINIKVLGGTSKINKEIYDHQKNYMKVLLDQSK